MQRTLRNLAVALVAGTFAIAAGAQDKGEKSYSNAKKADAPEKASKKAAASGGGKIVVNGVIIPQSRIDAMNKELSTQGQPDTPERQQAVRDELINREILAQAAVKRGLDKGPDITAQMDMARQAVLVRALFENELKGNPITDARPAEAVRDVQELHGHQRVQGAPHPRGQGRRRQAIIADLNKGGDFAKIAKEKSKDPGSKDNGGDLDWGPSARYVKPFADAVTTQAKGKISAAPVKTDFGYHIIRVDDVRPLKVPEFAEMKEQFRQRAQQQAIQKMVMDLRSKAKIEER